jgi:ComF family protein
MRALLDLVAPTVCVGCGNDADGELCAACAGLIVVIGEPICERCGGPMRTPCPCEQLHGFRRARSLVAFAEPARALTLSLKRRGRRSTAVPMGRLLADLVLAHGLHTGTVTFVPGGRAARRRGFDHAELLARSVARSLGSRVAPLLTRTGDGPRQADVSLEQRRTNVRDRFVARPNEGTVLLVDDVFTTGATAEACATALRRAGAAAVDVVTWARTRRRSV